MFGSAVLEVGIGLTFFYLLLSVMCSAINEWISGMLALRGENLRLGIANLLHDGDQNNAIEQIFSHPLIKSLAKPSPQYTLFGNEVRRPSYIPPKVFSSVLMDLLYEKGGKQNQAVKDIHGLIESINDSELLNPDLRKTLMIFTREAGNEVNEIRNRIEDWYRDGMDRVSGWYKRKAQAIIFGIALVITFAANADTITIASTLWNDSALRAQVTQMAKIEFAEGKSKAATVTDVTREDVEEDAESTIQSTKDKLEQFPLGWTSTPMPTGFSGWLTKVIGLMVTVFSVSLGAPFWFDLLGKLIKVRSSIETERKDADSSKSSANQS